MTLDPVIKGWILKAEGDFAVAEHELSLPPEKMVREAVFFHCQHMAENNASHAIIITALLIGDD